MASFDDPLSPIFPRESSKDPFYKDIHRPSRQALRFQSHGHVKLLVIPCESGRTQSFSGDQTFHQVQCQAQLRS